MSHAIYQTPALILKTKNMRESNKLVYLYTQKFGLIYASMQSVRKMESKMRYHIHPYSLVDVDLVSGKNIWRITGVHEKISSFTFVNTPWYRIASRVSDTLVQMCPGEEANEALWQTILVFFENFTKDNENYIKEYEIITIIKILFNLGYWNGDDVIFQHAHSYQEELFQHIKKQQTSYIKKINQSFYNSQL